MKKAYKASTCRVAHVATETILDGSITETTDTVRNDNFTGQSKRGIWENKFDN